MIRKGIKRAVVVLLSTACVLSAVGCGGSKEATNNQVSQSAGEENTEKKKEVVLRQAMATEINSLDPNYNSAAASMSMIQCVNEGLYKYGPDGNVTLGLASDVKISEDGCTYTFTIRDGAVWSNGDPVTANDFYYSWRRLADPNNGCAYAYMLITAGIKNSKEVVLGEKGLDELGISVPDEKTFVVQLETPKSYFTDLLASGTYFMPVNQKYCESCKEQFMLDKEHTISCGAFLITKWEVGGMSYTMEKNPTYYDAENVTCDRMEYSVLTDEQQRILAWKSNKLDNVSLSGDYISMYENDPAKVVAGYPGMKYISFNTKNQFLANKNLRLAISTAINKQEIVDSILKNGSKASDYIIPSSFSKDSKGVTFRENIGDPQYNSYDLNKASEYLTAAKQELGTDSISIEFLYAENSETSAIAAYIQSQLQMNLPGLTVNLRSAEPNQVTKNMRGGTYDFAMTGWYADYQDPSTFLDIWIESSHMNYGSWENKEYNELYSKVVGEYATKEKERIEAQGQMEKLILEDAAILPVYQPSTVYLQNPELVIVKTVAGVQIPRYTHYKED